MNKQTDHIQMLFDIAELNSLFAEATNIESFLQKIVEMVGQHMHTDVCSIYLYHEKEKALTLTVTKGLTPETVSDIKLKLGEGLVGLSLKELRPVREDAASKNPNFRFFPGIMEEKYDAFIAVPIVQGKSRIGVLTVQRDTKHPFTEQDVLALRATTNQLASMIENARILMRYNEEAALIEEDTEVVQYLKFIRGTSASKGLAYAPIAVYSQQTSAAFFNQRDFKKQYVVEDFRDALQKTEEQLEALQESVEEKLSDVASLIFSAHLLMLKDTEFLKEIEKRIEEGQNPPAAVLRVGRKYRDIFAASPNVLIQEKTQDLEDLLRRLINNLLGDEFRKEWYDKHIVIANELLPSDLLKLSSQNVDGLILVKGGVTSHVSILARSLQIPLVLANVPELLQVPEKTMTILDAEAGNIYIDPSKTVIEEFQKNIAAKKNIKELAEELQGQAKTKDGIKMHLFANINLLSDVRLAHDTDAEGIGLYRTEFPFMVRTNFPSEEEQFIIYQKLVKEMGDKPITFRTLDIGGDKVLTYYQDSHEVNPSMGLRSIRFSLKHEDVFAQQIRAILRAGAGANLRIMFPMISSVDELVQAKKIVASAKEELKEKGTSFHPNPKIGIMIEIPSTIHILKDLAKYTDFFSVGTNDLIQFLLAVDRTNEKLQDYYNPFHPSVMRALKEIIDVTYWARREVSICGDMAHDEKYLPFLLGIGFRNLSLDANYIPKVKKAISTIHTRDARKFSKKLLSCGKLTEVESFLENGKKVS